jgi:cell division protein FtsB
MAADLESRGLKIAVSAFISISVVLAVALYFLYSAYTSAEFRLADIRTQNEQLRKSHQLLQTRYDELKTQMNKLSASRPQ